MTWDIVRCDEDSDSLKTHLELGWEPFAVTAEKRLGYGWDRMGTRIPEEVSWVNVIWLRKSFK